MGINSDRNQSMHRFKICICAFVSINYIKNNAWVTVNTDFFGEEWGDLSENHWHCTSQVTKKSLFTVTNVLFLIVTRYFISWTHIRSNNNRSFTSPLSPRKVFSDLTLWRHQSWPVTSRENEVLALWWSCSSIVLARANWHKGDLHYWITTVNIDFSPPGIQSLAFKIRGMSS